MQCSVTIDGKNIQAERKRTILEVARENGINIPTLCYYKNISPTGVCRLCVVEIEGAKRLVASCCTPLAEGMVILTNSERVRRARRVILNLLLSSHPQNCVICSTANICELQKLALEYGVCESVYKNRKRFYQPEDVSPYVFRDLSKCILCYRCVAMCKNIKKANIYAVSYRGFNSKITVDTDVPINKEECKDCDLCIKSCPVGALLKPDKRFEKKHKEVFYISG